MPDLAFVIPGAPVPQGSLRAMRIKGGGIVVRHANADRLALYRADVARIIAALWQGRPPIDWPISVRATMFLERPLEHFQGRDRNRPIRAAFLGERITPRRPDLDKAGRALLDALVVGELIADDSLVSDLELSKRYGRPHTAVWISWKQ